MQFAQSDSAKWSFYGLLSLLWILVFSAITLALSGVYGHRITSDHKDGLEGNTSTATLVFYCGTMPFLTCLVAIPMILLHRTTRMTFTIAMALSAVLSIGWIVQIAFWGGCEIGTDITEVSVDYCPKPGPNDLGSAKFALAFVVLAGFLFYIGVVTHEFVQKKKATGTSSAKYESMEAEGLSPCGHENASVSA